MVQDFFINSFTGVCQQTLRTFVNTQICLAIRNIQQFQASFAELFFTMILAYVVLAVATREIPADWKTKQKLWKQKV